MEYWFIGGHRHCRVPGQWTQTTIHKRKFGFPNQLFSCSNILINVMYHKWALKQLSTGKNHLKLLIDRTA